MISLLEKYAPAILIAIAVSAASCVGVTQQLGGDDDVEAGAPPPTVQLEVTCPAQRPVQASDCAMHASEPCAYFAPLEGCTTTCVCAADHRWACFDVSCGVLLPDACSEGSACAPATRCVTPASGGDMRDCTCVDGTLACTTRAALR